MVSGNKLVSSLYWLCCCRRNRSFEESQQQPQQQQLEQQNMCTPLQDVCYAMLCFSCAFAFALAMLCLNACLQAGWANCINPLRRALKRIVIKGGDDNFKSAIESGGPPQCQLNKVENARHICS
uniref:HDC16060 n=1 Tax=Drosophila melanogaster TaxID=7227 RepID=Q6IJ32_DROME|nr:TPA_inf: HDC16060 [Drosophila melanogaster]